MLKINQYLKYFIKYFGCILYIIVHFKRTYNYRFSKKRGDLNTGPTFNPLEQAVQYKFKLYIKAKRDSTPNDCLIAYLRVW